MTWPDGLPALTSNQQAPLALTTMEADREPRWYVAVPEAVETSAAGRGGAGRDVAVLGGAEVGGAEVGGADEVGPERGAAALV